MDGSRLIERDPYSLASLGVQFSTEGGQAFFEYDRANEFGDWGGYAPLEELLCPAHLADIADTRRAATRRWRRWRR